MNPVYNIAVLGFGSLPNQIQSESTNQAIEVTKPQESFINRRAYNLKPESPFVPADLTLPIRLGRLSGDGTPNRRVTLILYKGASEEPVFYALSKKTTLTDAVKNLQAREGCPTDRHIGYVDLVRNTKNARINEVAEKIAAWGRQKGLQAVIWCDLPEKGIQFSPSSTGREITPRLRNDLTLLRNTQRYIRCLATHPNRLQRMILELQSEPIVHNPSSLPGNAESLGMTQQEMEKINQFLASNYESLKHSKKTFKHDVVYPIDGQNWKLPRTLVFLEGGTPVVHLKNVPHVGMGGERIAKRSYNPISGETIVKKRVLARCELMLIRNLINSRPKGIVETLGLRKVTIAGGDKYQVYEKCYDMNIKRFLDEQKPTLTEKIQMIKTLLNALQYVHRIDYTFCPDSDPFDMSEEDFAILRTYGEVIETVKCKHGDLKEENILIRRTPHGIESALSDFGCSEPGRPGNQFHLSPEDCNAAEDSYGYHPDAFHHPGDVWAMGLLIGNLIKDSHPTQEMLPLQCLDGKVQEWNRDPQREGRFLFVDFPQAPIDAEIASIISRCGTDREGQLKVLLWKLVNRMLQVKPNKRIKLDQAIREFNLMR